ncbi:DNA helicase HerA-like ATPase [Sphingobium sp. B12D2B]|nr:DNA helicase HerA-like ATPase [Sphingobium sp. B12D2B]
MNYFSGRDLDGQPVPVDAVAQPGVRPHFSDIEIGVISAISGGSAKILLDIAAMERLAGESDPSIAMGGQVGSQLKMRVGACWIVATVRTLALDSRSATHILADIDFVGEGDQEQLTGRIFRFRRGVTRFPVPGTPIYPVSSPDMLEIYSAHDQARIEIGTVYPTANTRASLLVDALLGKHFALLGSTGTGKSTSAALILHRICDMAPQGHIVMIDPHGEYGAAFAGNGAVYDTSNLELPYWLMNFEEHCEVLVTSKGPERAQDCDILAKCLLAARGRSRLAEGIGRLTVDSPVPYLLSDLAAILANEMGKLDKSTNSLPYLRLRTRLDEIKADPRFSFMFSGMLVADSMQNFFAKLFRLPAMGKPISIVDTSAMPSEITHVVVSVLARLIFDFAIWARDEEQKPILLVCEEAHRYIPSSNIEAGQSVRKILERIAKEGRKYGVSLGLITQRPSDLAEGVLSQCGTLIAMRLNNERDQQFVKAAMPEGSRGFLDSIPALRNRECIVCGEGVTVPIRVAFDDLEAARRPASADPVFSDLWRQTGGEEEILERTINRWRNQGR